MESNDIGWAITNLKDGKCVARKGWNGKGMFLALVAENWNGSFFHYGNHAPDDYQGVLSFVALYTADKKFIPWTCSQSDLLATD